MERPMESYACDSCRHWLRNTGAFGECRRHAPTVQLVPYTERLDTLQPVAIWPGTLATHWCGEHSPVIRSPAQVHPLPRRPSTGETPQPAAIGEKHGSD